MVPNYGLSVNVFYMMGLMLYVIFTDENLQADTICSTNHLGRGFMSEKNFVSVQEATKITVT